MGFFDGLFGKSKSKSANATVGENGFRSEVFVGITEDDPAKCPHCQVELIKRPKAKTKCKSCDEFMFSRTRPSDNKKVIVTAEQAQLIEFEWMKVHGTYDYYIKEKATFEIEREKLTKKFKGAASDSDVRWSLLNKRFMKACEKQDWTEYCRIRNEMAGEAIKSNKHAIALPLLYEAIFLGVNFWYLNDHTQDPELIKQVRGGKYEPDEISDYSYKQFMECLEKTCTDIKKAETDFLKFAGNLQKGLKLPFPPETVWQTLANYNQKVAA